MAKQSLINKKDIENKLNANKHLAIIISGPSGTGKTTIIKRLTNELENLQLSISSTTRTPRNGEIDGKDYFFVNISSFKEKIQQENFLEYDFIYGNFYGTSKKQIFQSFESKKDIIFDINWHGASQIRTKINSLLIYLLPPSLDELKNRLSLRNQDSLEAIEKRLSRVKEEIQYVHYYDYVLINDDLENTVNKIKLIIEVERIKLDKKQAFVNYLSNEIIY